MTSTSIQTISPSKLLGRLLQYGMKIYIENGTVKVLRPKKWPTWNHAPAEVVLLLRELIARQKEVDAFMRDFKARMKAQASMPQPTVTAQKTNFKVRPDVLIRLHPMRDACRKVGRCLAQAGKIDCELYPVKPGWCRERGERQENLKRSANNKNDKSV